MHKRPVNLMDNLNADRVKRVAQLTGRSAVRKKRQQFLVEGPQSCREAIKAHLGLLPLSPAAQSAWPQGQTISEVYFTKPLSTMNPELMQLIGKLGNEVFVAETTHDVLQAMSDAVIHQNIILIANMPDKNLGPNTDADLVAGMIRVQDPGNAGTIIRVADAVGANYVFTSSNSVDIFNPKTVRSTAGSLFHIAVFRDIELTMFANSYTGQIFAADGYGSITLETRSQTMLKKPTAWLFGNEAQGLNEAELSMADHRIAVPLYGLAESLNVATAATVCLYASSLAQRSQD